MSIVFLTAIIGSLLGGPLLNKIGRKPTILTNALFNIVINGLLVGSYYLDSIWLFILGRAFLGVNIGLNSEVGPTYLSEISPDELSSFFGSSFQLGVSLGIFFAQLFGLKWFLGTSDLWVFIYLVSVIISILQIIVAFSAPESYVYYSYHGLDVKARRNFEYLFGTSKEIPVISNDKVNIFENMRQVFRNKTVRSSTITVCLLMIFTQFSGFIAIIFYSTGILNKVGLDDEFSGSASVLVMLFNFLSVILASFVVKKFSRKTMLLLSMTGLCIINFLMPFILYFYIFYLTYITIVPFVLFIIIFENGPGHLALMMAGELTPVEYKATVSAIAGSFNWIGSFLVALIFPYLYSWIGPLSFLFFSLSCALGVIFVFFGF